MADRRITLAVTPEARLLLAEKGYDPSYGARPLKRLIQREIADKAAVLILEGKAVEDSTVLVTANNSELGVQLQTSV
jgi:ATP-dependent Clp protease ATP-binding subunit ClpB